MTYGPVYKRPISFRGNLDPRNSVFRTIFLCSAVILILSFGFCTFWTSRQPPSIAPPSRITKSSDSLKDLFKDEYIQRKDTPNTNVGIPARLTLQEEKEQYEYNAVTGDNGVATKRGVLTNQGVATIRDVSLNSDVSTTINLSSSTSINLSSSTTLDQFKGENDHSSEVSKPGFSWDDPRLDILHMAKPEFNPKFENPCWYEPLPSTNPYTDNKYTLYSPAARDTLAMLKDKWAELSAQGEELIRLRCLPYFLIIGQPKCGSTDLFWKIAKHPDIDTPPIKELHWWSRNRQGRRFSYAKIIPFSDYVDMFDKVAVRIEERVASLSLLRQQATATRSQIVTGEASVSVLWDNNDWMNFPENRDLQEPLYVNAHYVHHIIPAVRLIVILRDPIERMYSDYLYFHSANKSTEDFHRSVQIAISCYRECMAEHSIRYCAHNMDTTNRAKIRLRVGIYSVFLKDWLNVFPRQQFYILRLEDYSKDPLKYIKEIYKFLNVRDLTLDEEERILHSPISNVRKESDREIGNMSEETRKLLNDFYRPFNMELAKMLQDKRFLWLDKD